MSVQPPTDPAVGESHLDLDALADVLAEASTTAARAHLLTCARCSAALAELDVAQGQVVAALAALPVPELPVGLVAQLESALADERRGWSAPGPAAPPDGPTNTVVPVTRRKDRRKASNRWLPWAAGLAAAAVLVSGGLLLRNAFPGKGSSSDTAATSRAVEMVRNDTGTPYAKDGKALTAALPSLLNKTARAGAAAAPQYLAPSPGRVARDQLGATANTLRAPMSLATLRSTQGLASCLAALTDPSVPGLPLAIDYATFDGQPALVVVLPSTIQNKVDVFIVGSGCTPADAHVLFFMRLAKPA